MHYYLWFIIMCSLFFLSIYVRYSLQFYFMDSISHQYTKRTEHNILFGKSSSEFFFMLRIFMGMTRHTPKIHSQMRGAPSLKGHFSSMARLSTIFISAFSFLYSSLIHETWNMLCLNGFFCRYINFTQSIFVKNM